MWDRSDDSVWTRLDRWSRWGMNSCRRGLADRTWSVTRWLWRDRYTLSCLEENNYTHSVPTQTTQTKHQLISFICLFIDFIWLYPFSHQLPIHIFDTPRWLWYKHTFTQWSSLLPYLWPLQSKDLKSRVSHLEGSQKSNKEGLVAQLEGRIQELEERLEGEERWDEGFRWELEMRSVAFRWWKRKALGGRWLKSREPH